MATPTATLIALHEKCKKLDSDELILMLCKLAIEQTPADRKKQLFKIFKTYLYQALAREGFSGSVVKQTIYPPPEAGDDRN